MTPTVHVRRSYVECRYGQLHLLTAYPSGGGFDELTPLVCIHQADASGRSFSPLLPELGGDRSVYAPDLPGHGQSDSAGHEIDQSGAARLGIVEYANAIGDFLDALRLRSVDLIGYHQGSLVAAELAATRSQQIRRVVMLGAPIYAPEEKLALASHSAAVREDGDPVIGSWQSLLRARGPGVTMQSLIESFADRLRAAETGQTGTAAAADYPAAQRFPLVKQPVLLLRAKDELWEQTTRARTLLSRNNVVELPEYGAGILNAAPHRVAQLVREFLDR